MLARGIKALRSRLARRIGRDNRRLYLPDSGGITSEHREGKVAHDNLGRLRSGPACAGRGAAIRTTKNRDAVHFVGMLKPA